MKREYNSANFGRPMRAEPMASIYGGFPWPGIPYPIIPLKENDKIM